MKLLLLAVSLPCALLSACVDGREGEREHRGGHDRGATLPNDAYYIGVPLPFKTVDECVAAGKDAAACTHAVALCASGAYGVRAGTDITSGRYHLDDHHAVSRTSCHGDHDGEDHDDDDNVDDASSRFDFDVEAGQLVGDRAAIAWEPDYDGRWKTAAGSVIDCSARPPRR